MAGLLAADYVLVPTKLRFTDLDGVSEVIRSIQEVSRHGHPIQHYTFLPTFYDRTTKETPLMKHFDRGIFARSLFRIEIPLTLLLSP